MLQNKVKIINDKNRNYIQHLNLLRDSSYIPDSFKTDYIDSKGRNKKVFIKRYVDLETGQIYTKDNANFIPIAPEQTDKKEISIELGDDEK